MNKREHNIDVLKMLAIASVILIHFLPSQFMRDTGSYYHIRQAVPIFMLLAGYNLANSYERRGFSSMKELYKPSFLYGKVKRIIFPFLLILVLEIAVLYILREGSVSNARLVRFLIFRWGPGSYFVPIIIQTTLLMPVIHRLVKWKPFLSLVLIFIASLLLEWVCVITGIPESTYKRLVVRYIFALALGAWFALNRDRLSFKWLAPLALISLVYITAVNYNGLVFITTFWGSQHAPAYFYTLALTALFLKGYQFSPEKAGQGLLIKLGQASYHIFLVQMAYFKFVPEEKILKIMPMAEYRAISLVVPMALGLLFFNLENAFRKRLRNRQEKMDNRSTKS
ncbi:acyltransferase [Tissierella creatinini]|nr:acyltransferase [Tissierella creatinini]TJX59539.1 acyltransferase [Soehngenia saccharolytica]